MEEATSTIRGGEKLALESLDSYLEDKKAVVNFEKPKTNPGASTTARVASDRVSRLRPAFDDTAFASPQGPRLCS